MKTAPKLTETTYAIDDKIEYLLVLPAGAANVEILFDGGTFTGYGTTPATFTTSNPALQALVENSEYFKSNRIYKMR